MEDVGDVVGEEFSNEANEFDVEEDIEDHEEEKITNLDLGSWNPSFGISNRAKLAEILKNLHSPEIRIYSDASKEFIGLLNSESGGEILREYVQLSSKCVELTEAWRLHKEKPGMAYVLSLLASIFTHPEGKSHSSAIKKSLDGFARMLVEEKEKLGDVYVELNSQEWRRQNAALDLLASIVKRGVGLASEVAKNFEFKLPVLSQLSGLKKKARKDTMHRRKGAGFSPTRRAFIRFAMSFVEVGNPRLLRWILQQRELYSGMLRGIGTDDAETVVYVLSTLRDKVLTEESLVPPGLRSVLFGSATLEQLSFISGNPVGGDTADLAHEVLVMVCTDPRNGLMPSSSLRGNEKRLLDLLKKLKATEVAHHKQLLLTVVSKRPSLCSAYMDEFPYNLEPRPSSSWFAAISLAADMISSVKCDAIIESVSSCSHDLVAVDDEEGHGILKCIMPRACSRSVINRGLLHSDDLVKHGSLRLVLESVNLLCCITKAIDDKVSDMSSKQHFSKSTKMMASINGFPGLSSSTEIGTSVHQMSLTRWAYLKEYIQDEVRGALPDPQVLLKLLSSMSQKHQENSGMRSKRRPQPLEPVAKKRKSDTITEDVDIVIGGMKGIADVTEDEQHSQDASQEKDLDNANDCAVILSEIWHLNENDLKMDDMEVVEDLFHLKLLDVLRLYLRAMPGTFDGSFDFFRVIPPDPLGLSNNEQQSLLSLLVEYTGQSEGGRELERVPESMYKHLQPLINILLYSQVKSVQDQAYILVKAAMVSSGAFDQNFTEINAWLVFLPGYGTKRWCGQNPGVEASHEFSRIIVPFICDAVSIVGNNLYKYQDHMRKLISILDHSEGCSPTFSPLILCILQKCLRLLDSESGNIKLHERSIISLYVCNTISLILQSQADMRSLPYLISTVLNERFKNFSSEEMDSKIYLCEWRPLINLLHYSQIISDQQSFKLFNIPEYCSELCGSSLFSVICKVQEILNEQCTNLPTGVATAFLLSIMCASPKDVIENFLLLLDIANIHFCSQLPFLSSVLFLQHDYMVNVASLWPDVFFNSLQMIKGDLVNSHINDSKDLSQNLAVSGESAGLIRFLNDASFCALFPAVLSLVYYTTHATRKADFLLSDVLVNLLRVKISESTIDELLLSLRVVLFWSYHMLSSYILKPLNILEEISEICFTLVDYIFDCILLLAAANTISKSEGRCSFLKCIQDIVDSVLQHPIINLSLSCSLSDGKDLSNESFAGVKEAFTSFSKENLHLVDRGILQLLSKLFDFLLTTGTCEANYFKSHHLVLESVFDPPRLVVQNILLLFKEKFELCMDKGHFGPLLPIFSVVRTLTKFMSPFMLLELAYWMFSKLDVSVCGCSSIYASSAFLCLCIADIAMEMLYGHLQQTDLEAVSYLFWDRDIENSDPAILQKVYSMILHFATSLNLEFTDLCLLKTLNHIHHTGMSTRRNADHHLPFYMLLSSMTINSPMAIFHQCIFPTTKVKAKTLQLLIDVSPMHMSLFGQMFMGVLNKDTSILEVFNVDAAWPSDDDAILLLPASLSWIKYNMDDNNQNLEHLRAIPIFYSRILLNGFSSWKSFVSRSIFEEELCEFRPSSFEDFKSHFSNTLLGKAVTMLQYFFTSDGTTITQKQRLDIFCFICPQSAELVDSDFSKMNADSCEGIFKLTNEVCAKMLVVRMLLSPTNSSNEMALDRESKSVNKAKQMFISILVRTLDRIVTNFPQTNGLLSYTGNHRSVVHFLECAILKDIIELSLETHNYLNQLKSIPFLNLFIRSSLLHRFNDPITVKAIRCILVILSEGKFSAAEILELLLGHSCFASTITCSEFAKHPATFTPTGSLLQPIPSILKSVDASFTEEKKLEVCASEKRKLETIRLLRVLYHIKSRQQDNSLLNESRELLFLLLSVYGATRSEADLEVLYLMNEIESSEGSEFKIIAEMDYLWGSAAAKVRDELKLDTPRSNIQNMEYASMDERRRTLFRENIPIDSKLCVMTILQFYNDRSSGASVFPLEKLLQDKFWDNLEILSPSMGAVQIYDLAFILRFSIHSLLMGYLEPIDFSRLGLLAISLVSISSPDEELRKLGYVSLGTFKQSLESSRKSKETWQLQLLLTYLQNGISEKWQKIPSITAIFAAEASFTLLDPSHIHFFTISKFLTHSPSVNLMRVPLFQTLFHSTSVHFKADRLWMLHLLYAGLNLSDDAKIYKRDSVLELALGFYSSSISDSESKILILQILKKAVKREGEKLPLLAHYLIKECGLLSWLSSILLLYGERLGDDKKSSLRIIELVLKVITELISAGKITEWLQESALEQVSEICSYLYTLLVRETKLLKGNVSLLNSIVHVMASALRLSMKRKIYQPHFTLSLDGILQLCQVIGGESRTMELELTMKHGIDVILMNGPVRVVSDMDKSKVVKVVTWATSTSLWLLSNQRPLPETSREEQLEKECLVPKILRWLTASVILGSISNISHEASTDLLARRLNLGTLHSFLDCTSEKNKTLDNCSTNENLAEIILYLQGLVRKNNDCLPSVIMALCLLLLGRSSRQVAEYLEKKRDQIALLCSKINCPAETNPAWRWSYYQPWRDLTLQQTETERLEEEQACRSLLIIFASAFAAGMPGLPVLSLDDVQKSGLFQWERDTMIQRTF